VLDNNCKRKNISWFRDFEKHDCEWENMQPSSFEGVCDEEWQREKDKKESNIANMPLCELSRN